MDHKRYPFCSTLRAVSLQNLLIPNITVHSSVSSTSGIHNELSSRRTSSIFVIMIIIVFIVFQGAGVNSTHVAASARRLTIFFYGTMAACGMYIQSQRFFSTIVSFYRKTLLGLRGVRVIHYHRSVKVICYQDPVD